MLARPAVRDGHAPGLCNVPAPATKTYRAEDVYAGTGKVAAPFTV
jgi:hypothetical protein